MRRLSMTCATTTAALRERPALQCTCARSAVVREDTGVRRMVGGGRRRGMGLVMRARMRRVSWFFTVRWNVKLSGVSLITEMV